MQRLTESRDRPLPQWAVVGLVSVLLVSVAAFVVVFARSTASTSSIRSEAEKEVLIADMDTAVQVEAEHAGQLAGQITIDRHDEIIGTAPATGSDNSTLSAPTGSPDPLSDHHPEVPAAVASYGEAVGGLRRLMPASELGLLDDAVAAHAAFTASIAELAARSHAEAGVMSFYHADTQKLEATLRSSLQALQQASIQRLQSAISQARSAETLLRVALPVILITGLFAAIYLLRTRAMRRRVTTLESLVTAKDEFIGVVSHELRTPLTGIVGFADLLHQAEETLTAHERAEMVASIAEQSHEVAGIVEDLLVAARAEIGELSIITVPVDLRAQASQVLEGIRLHLDLAGVDLTGADPAAVVGDPARVRQVLRNLLTNAARYGSGNVQVEYGTTIEHGYLRVRNRGPAIPDQDRERIFEPYQRAHNNAGEPGSIGLGLAVSRRLARLMGGDLTYRHRDVTSIFELTLPLGTATEPAAPAATELATT